MRFTKMHGLGNDFIVVDAIHNSIADPADTARRVCQRRFAIGADGLILICESDRADAAMRIYFLRTNQGYIISNFEVL